MTSAQPVAGAAARPQRTAFATHDVRPGSDDALAHLHAHTLIASTQAAAACGELAEILDMRGDHVPAALFRQLAVAEAERAAEAIRGIGQRPLPQGPAWQHYSWLYHEVPNGGARKLVARLITAPLALRIALEVGERVRALYEHLAASAEDARARSQARDLAAEKSHQLRLIAEALAASGARTERSGENELLFAMP